MRVARALGPASQKLLLDAQHRQSPGHGERPDIALREPTAQLHIHRARMPGPRRSRARQARGTRSLRLQFAELPASAWFVQRRAPVEAPATLAKLHALGEAALSR